MTSHAATPDHNIALHLGAVEYATGSELVDYAIDQTGCTELEARQAIGRLYDAGRIVFEPDTNSYRYIYGR